MNLFWRFNFFLHFLFSVLFGWISHFTFTMYLQCISSVFRPSQLPPAPCTNLFEVETTLNRKNMHSKTDIQLLHTPSLFGNACRFKVAIWKKVTCLHHWADLEGDLTNLRTLNTQYIAYFPTSSKKIATTCKNMKFKKLCGFYGWIMLRRTGYRNIYVCVCVLVLY